MEQKWNYMENKANEILDCTTNCISRFTPPHWQMKYRWKIISDS